jgi:hypothetical protein
MNDKFKTIEQIISIRSIAPKHLDITSRQVSYWKEKKILPFFDKSAHSKMNIPMATWMFIVRELSELGINTQKLASLAREIWQTPREEHFLKGKIKKYLDSKIGRSLDIETKDRLFSIINDPILLDTLGQESNPFTDHIIDSILLERNPASLYYFPKSEAYFISMLQVKEATKILSLMETEPFLCVPLTPFLKNAVSVEMNLIQGDLLYLSEVENQIRDIVIFKAPKNILILLDDQKIEMSIIRDQHKDAKQLSDFFMNNKLPKNSKLIVEPRAQGNYKLTIITK